MSPKKRWWVKKFEKGWWIGYGNLTLGDFFSTWERAYAEAVRQADRAEQEQKMHNSTIEQMEHFKKVMEPTPPFLEALIAEKQAHEKLRAGVQEMRDWYIARSQRMRRAYAETFHSKFADRAEYHKNVADMLNDILEENK